MKNEDFNDIYQKYHRFSVNTARKIVKDKMLAEDISQEVFYHLYEIGDSLDITCERKMKALVFTATVNKAKDCIRKPWKKREKHIIAEDMYEDLFDANLNPEKIMIREEDLKYRQYVLNKLRHENPVNYDILVKLKYFGFPPDLVAKEYGITKNNMNNRVLRTRKWLKKELDKIRKFY